MMISTQHLLPAALPTPAAPQGAPAAVQTNGAGAQAEVEAEVEAVSETTGDAPGTLYTSVPSPPRVLTV